MSQTRTTLNAVPNAAQLRMSARKKEEAEEEEEEKEEDEEKQDREDEDVKWKSK